MRSVNFDLRKAYMEALAAIIYDSLPVQVFYGNAPSDITDKNYIVINGISNNDASTINSFDTITLITVGIYSFDDNGNSGKAADDIADIVLQRIIQDGGLNIAIGSNFQIASTILANDRVNDWTMSAGRVYIDRLLTFRHQIFQRA